MASISSLGSASGLDLDGILTKIRAVEEKRLTLINNRASGYNTQITAYGKVKSAVEAVQKAANALASTQVLNAVKSTVTGSNVNVTTDAGAVAGDYKLEVTNLASAQRLQLTGSTDRTAQIGSGGTISIDTGHPNGPTEITLGSDTSLNGIMRAINDDDKAGVRASIITDQNGESHLVMTAKKTGTEAAVTNITVTGNPELANVMNYSSGSPGNYAVVDAQNAEFTINGLNIISQTNSVSTVVDNVTFNLTDLGTSTVSITNDNDAIVTAVKDFVSAYNALQSTITELTAFEIKEGSRGGDGATQSALTGDSTTRNVQTSLSSALRAAGDISFLGIKTSDFKTGTVTLDETTLRNILNDNPAAVASSFTAISTEMDAAAKRITNSVDGTITNRTNGLNKTIRTLEAQHARTSLSIDTMMEGIRAQFVALDALVARMQGTSDYLTQQFNALNNSRK